MKYILNQKLISLGDDFYIEDENGKEAFKVDGKLFSIGEKLWFKDSNGNKIYKLKEKLIKLTDTYIIEKDNQEYAKIHKKMFNLFREKFEIKTNFGIIEAKGNFIDYDFKFYLDKKEIAQVSKKFISIRDKYVVEINSFKEPELILACVVIIDMIIHNDEKDKKISED